MATMYSSVVSEWESSQRLCEQNERDGDAGGLGLLTNYFLDYYETDVKNVANVSVRTRESSTRSGYRLQGQNEMVRRSMVRRCLTDITSSVDCSHHC